MTTQRLQHILDAFPRLRIAILGDYALDKWLHIDRSLDEPSVETGLTAYQVVKKRTYAGASGTVLANLSALDVGTLIPIGIVGDDGEAYDLLRDLKAHRADTRWMVQSDRVMTFTYTKPLFVSPDGTCKESNRLDHHNPDPTPPDLQEAVLDNLRRVLPQVDAVIILDQVTAPEHGVVTTRVRQAITKVAAANPRVIFYADSRARISLFRDVIIKCNDLEAIRAVHPELQGKQPLETVRECLPALSRLTRRPVFVTCGKDGILALGADGRTAHVPGVRVEGPIDIVGAGDSCTAGSVAALCAGATLEEAAAVGNLTASLTVQVIGTTGTTTRPAILKRFQDVCATGVESAE